MPTDTSRPALVRRSRPPEIPLSFAQHRLWFLNRLDGPRPNYSELLALRFSHDFDRSALVAALDDLVERHESLRTVFPETNAVPRQHILDLAAARPQLIEISVPEGQIRREIDVAGQRRFDLTIEAPLRAYLFQREHDDHMLLLVIHHIAIDGWSINRVLIRDLIKAYKARCQGAKPDFAPLPVQYADYAIWHLQLLGGEDDPSSVTSQQLAFWKNTLDRLPKQLPLPTDRPRPLTSSFRGGTVPLEIDERLHAAVLALARRNRATIFMVLNASVAALLSRLGAGTDIPIGTAVSGRATTAVSDVVGFFANTVVVRTDTSGNPTFRGLLARVRRCVLDGCAHDALPFDRVVEALNPSRSISRNPLFQVMLGFQTAMPRGADVSDGRISHVFLRRIGDHSRFDLSFEFAERPGPRGVPRGIIGTLRYSTDIFHATTATRMAAQLVAFLQSAVVNPDQHIEQIDVLTAAERQQLVCTWSTCQQAAPASLVSDQIEVQVARTPAAEAVVCGEERCTYAELNTAANQLARELIGRGVGAEDVIGVALPRSVEMVAALLGVLKSGAAWLALDPEQPMEYLARLLGETRPRWVLTTRDTARMLPAATPAIAIDDLAARAALEPGAAYNPTEPERSAFVVPQQAAYVAYSAGTTAKSGAVVATQAGLGAAVAALAHAVPLTAADRVLAATPVGADRALAEWLWPLVSGATVVVATAEDALYPALLAQLIARQKVTVLPTTPRVARAIGAHRGTAATLRVVVGREPLAPDVALDLRRMGMDVVQVYGTTETTIWNACAALNPETDANPPVGAPIAHTRLYVLDRWLQPVPIGVPGDLYAGGSTVARGYLARSAATAARFVADPYGPAGTRMVRTGDRARWNADGHLELIARRDRAATTALLDTAIVEAALRSQPDVHDALVEILPGASGTPRCVAYVVAAAGRSFDDSAVRQQLARTLPDAMVPEVVVALDRLPLTPNGTLDRGALPEPVARIDARRQPQTPTEECLCSLFAEVLGVPQVALDDNFFELGGHSLLVTKLINRARTVLGIELEIRTVFDAPTVAGLVQRLDVVSTEAVSQ